MLSKSDFHPYQHHATDHVLQHEAAGLFIGLGLGKTVITLTAVSELMFEEMAVNKTLVIAPKRVAEHTWTTEAAKWSHLKHLRISKVMGNPKQRTEALKADADIYIINRDNVQWLVGQYGAAWPFDCVVIDELSSFKSAKSQRFKALRMIRPRITRMIGLTGTPASNGLLDLWAQLYLLDQGQRLGKTITEYRNNYFKENRRNGHIVYDYKLRGEPQEIYDKIGDICISMKAEDYLQLPERIDRIVEVTLSDEDMKAYLTFEEEQVLAMSDEEEISAVNAAALTNKLLQFANGAVYREDHSYYEVHNAKLDALEEDIEAANGSPYLVFYQYKSDLERITERLKSYKPKTLKDGDSIDAFSRGDVQVLLAHAASAGHGIDGLQKAGHLVGWYGVPWSLELYLQATGRLDRQGQTERVVNTRFVVKGTMDEEVVAALERKAVGQEALLDAVKARIKKYREL